MEHEESGSEEEESEEEECGERTQRERSTASMRECDRVVTLTRC